MRIDLLLFALFCPLYSLVTFVLQRCRVQVLAGPVNENHSSLECHQPLITVRAKVRVDLCESPRKATRRGK